MRCISTLLRRHSVSSFGVDLNLQAKALELPKEHEMPAKDKYTVFSKHEKGYRKGIHKVPKWTRVSPANVLV